MTHAFAIGYDWLYSSLFDAEKVMICGARIEKGLNQREIERRKLAADDFNKLGLRLRPKEIVMFTIEDIPMPPFISSNKLL